MKKHTSPVAPHHHHLLKRLIASVLLLCFGLFSLEVLIADVHDGDAQGERGALASNEQSVMRNSVDQSDNGATVSFVSLDEQTATQDDRGAPAVPTQHAAHVCHCVHAHGVSAPAVASLPPLPEVSRAVASLVIRTPDQVDVDVHLRPPIA